MNYLLSKDITSFYKAVIGAVMSHGLALLISFAGSVLLTRALGAEGRGIVAWIMSFSSIGIILAQAGMGHTNRRFSAARHHRTPTLITLTFIICTIVGLLAGLILGIIALRDVIGQENKGALLLAFLLIPISAISLASGEMLIGLGKNAQYSVLNIIEKSCNTLLIIAFVVLGIISPPTAIIALALAAVIRLIAVIYYLRHKIKFKLKGAGYILKHIGSFTFFNYVASSSLFLSTHIVVIFVASMSSTIEAGFYAANMIIINALRQLANTTGLFALPKLTAINDPKARSRLKKSVIIITLTLTITAGLIFTFSANWLIPLIFGKEFITAVASFKILLIGLVFCSMLFISQSFIAADSKGYIVTIAPIVLIICTIYTAITFIPEQGAIGAAYSWSISHAVAAVVSGIIAVVVCIKRNNTPSTLN